jgi:hypothetical protein
MSRNGSAGAKQLMAENFNFFPGLGELHVEADNGRCILFGAIT